MTLTPTYSGCPATEVIQESVVQALRNAGVPAEMHVYAQGSHGNSHDPQYGTTARWPKRAEEWMRFNGWLPPLPKTP